MAEQRRDALRDVDDVPVGQDNEEEAVQCLGTAKSQYVLRGQKNSLRHKHTHTLGCKSHLQHELCEFLIAEERWFPVLSDLARLGQRSIFCTEASPSSSSSSQHISFCVTDMHTAAAQLGYCVYVPAL